MLKRQNSKTSFVTEPKNSNWDKSQNLNMAMKLKHLICN